jgi:hypothetical protein
MKLTIIAVILSVIGLGLGLGACASDTGSQTTENTQAQTGIDLLLSNQPAPVFSYSAYRMNLIEMEAVQALGSPTTSFFFTRGGMAAGQAPIKVCTSQGLPIPNGTSLTNPWQSTDYGQNGGGNVAIGQMDPNGAYPSQSSSGTGVMCVDSKGRTKMAYAEEDVHTEIGAAVWNTSTHQIQDIGPSELPVCTIETYPPNTKSGGQNVGGKKYYHCVLAH